MCVKLSASLGGMFNQFFVLPIMLQAEQTQLCAAVVMLGHVPALCRQSSAAGLLGS